MKHTIYLAMILLLFGCVGNMDYQDALIAEQIAGCTTDSECGCELDCLDTEPRVSDTLTLTGGN